MEYGRRERETEIRRGERVGKVRSQKSVWKTEGKVMGVDEIRNEVCKYGRGEEVERWIWGLCNKVWKGKSG